MEINVNNSCILMIFIPLIIEINIFTVISSLNIIDMVEYHLHIKLSLIDVAY